MPRSKATQRDWLLGAAGKRLLLAALVADPTRRWTQFELAAAARLRPRGSVDEHLAALIQLDLLLVDDGRYALNQRSPLAVPIASVLAALVDVPDDPIIRP